MSTPGRNRHAPPLRDWESVTLSPSRGGADASGVISSASPVLVSGTPPQSQSLEPSPSPHSSPVGGTLGLNLTPRGAAVELRRARPATDDENQSLLSRASPEDGLGPLGSHVTSSNSGLHLRSSRSDSSAIMGGGLGHSGSSVGTPRLPLSSRQVSSASTFSTFSIPEQSSQCGPPTAACTCSCLGRQWFNCIFPRLSHIPGCGCLTASGHGLPGRYDSPQAKQRRTSCLGVWGLLVLTLLAGLQLATLYFAVNGVHDQATGTQRALFSGFFGGSSATGATPAGAAGAAPVFDALTVERLNASTHYQRSRAEHLERLMGEECLRQLKLYGWNDEQLRNDDFIMRAMSPWADDPKTQWPNDEVRSHWASMGCVDRILAPRARAELAREGSEALQKRIDADVLRREQVRNETHHMERGRYSLAHRREGECGKSLRCVIALSLYGSSPRYTLAIQSSVRRMPLVFPGWELRVYFDHTVPSFILQRLYAHAELAAKGDRPDLAKLELVNVTQTTWPVGSPELERITGAFYRFLVADDPTVDRWISRDCDALLLERDYAAVQEWMASGWTWHTMADFPQHGNMLAGMWGAVNYARDNGTFPDGTPRPKVTMVQDAFDGKSMQQLIEEYTLGIVVRDGASAQPKIYGVDQFFQLSVVWPVLREDYLGHDSYFCQAGRNTLSFPLPRPVPYLFIGQTQAADEDGATDLDRTGSAGVDWRTEPDYELWSKRPAPVECRRKPEWIYG